MKSRMSELMKYFFTRLGLSDAMDGFLFAGADGKPYSDSWVQRWFNVTIRDRM